MISPRNTAIGMLFQLTPSRRATSSSPALVTARTISTHALTEGDIVTFLSVVVFAIFQLTPSRRATTALIWFVNHFYNFNSRPHGGRPCAHCIIHFINCISTHALTEGDRIGQAVHNTVNISTHALTEGDIHRP